MKIHKEYSLHAENTFGLPCTADCCAVYGSAAQLERLSAIARKYHRVHVLGGGSNVLLPPHLTGLLIHVKSRGIRLFEETYTHWIIEAEAGESWHNFVRYTVQRGWPGLENLALIPGTVGASPVQNIGAYGVELDQRLHSVVAWHIPEARAYTFTPKDCEFAYRDSIFKRSAPGTWLITQVRFALPKQWEPVLSYPDLRQEASLQDELTPQAVFDAVVRIREAKLPDPRKMGNAGSFFKNPIVSQQHFQALRDQFPTLVGYPIGNEQYKLAAGWLIDRAGWKGKPVGAVAMHARQALVMTNLGGGSLRDVDALAEAICTDVYERFGVRLEQEPVRF